VEVALPNCVVLTSHRTHLSAFRDAFRPFTTQVCLLAYLHPPTRNLQRVGTSDRVYQLAAHQSFD